MNKFLLLARRSLTFRLIAAVLLFYSVVIIGAALTISISLTNSPFTSVELRFDQKIVELFMETALDGENLTPELKDKIDEIREPYEVAWFYLYNEESYISVGEIPENIQVYKDLQKNKNILSFQSETESINLNITNLKDRTNGCNEHGLCRKILISGSYKKLDPLDPQSENIFFLVFHSILTSYSMQMILLGTPFILFLTIFFVTKPLKKVAQAAQGIKPADLDIRLDESAVPLEVLPLVVSMNQALDRLDHGYNALGKFSAAAAHELRTPLTLFDIHLKDLPNGEPVQNLRRLVLRLQQVIDQILYLSLMGRGNTDLEIFDLITLTRETIADRAPLLESDGIDIEFSSEIKKFNVRGMKMAIYVSITNLIDNAAKHSKNGDLIEISVNEHGVKVIDRGPGLNEHFKPFAFEPFEKHDTNSVGFGLGLSIVEEIMKRHGGSVEYRDTEGGGATFTLNLPLSNISTFGTDLGLGEERLF